MLREYYEGAALVQVQIEARASSQGDGSGILVVLEIAESDFATGLAEARKVEDKRSVIGELNAALGYLDKLKPQCETKVPSDAGIKAARKAEIQGLNKALGILAGDGVPALLQNQ